MSLAPLNHCGNPTGTPNIPKHPLNRPLEISCPTQQMTVRWPPFTGPVNICVPSSYLFHLDTQRLMLGFLQVYLISLQQVRYDELSTSSVLPI